MSLVELAVLVLVGLAAAAAVVVTALAARRAARALYRARRRGGPGVTMARLGRELDPRLDMVQRCVDAVRHEQMAPVELLPLVSETLDEVAAASEAVKATGVRSEGEAARESFALELFRASRALESILDACLSLEGSTDAGRRIRATTVLKWGHVNLIHARDSLVEQVTRLEEAADASETGWRTSRI